MIDHAIIAAAKIVNEGGVIAYPTEAVYGLGCDPLNESAVARIAALKKRSLDKGFVVIASEWAQVSSWVAPLDEYLKHRVFSHWPGPINWIFPASDQAPALVCGEHSSIAIRLTSHPVARALCEAAGSALVSTSANLAGEPPFRNLDGLKRCFGVAIDAYVLGDLGGQESPCEIRDAVSGRSVR